MLIAVIKALVIAEGFADEVSAVVDHASTVELVSKLKAAQQQLRRMNCKNKRLTSNCEAVSLASKKLARVTLRVCPNLPPLPPEFGVL